jgi:hypothetical protein
VAVAAADGGDDVLVSEEVAAIALNGLSTNSELTVFAKSIAARPGDRRIPGMDRDDQGNRQERDLLSGQHAVSEVDVGLDNRIQSHHENCVYGRHVDRLAPADSDGESNSGKMPQWTGAGAFVWPTSGFARHWAPVCTMVPAQTSAMGEWGRCHIVGSPVHAADAAGGAADVAAVG